MYQHHFLELFQWNIFSYLNASGHQRVSALWVQMLVVFDDNILKTTSCIDHV